MRKIAIVGATGMLGQPVTKEFVQAGFEVTILARDAEKAKKVLNAPARIVQGNLEDKGSIERLLEGQEGLYLNLSVDPSSSEKDFQPEREGLQHLIEAAKKSTIHRIGYLSSLVHRYQGQNGFNWWAFDVKQQAVKAIKGSGIAYAIFYPSTFMENFDKGAYRQGNKLNLAGTSKYPMFLIAGSDYGKQVVKAFERDHGNSEYVVQGPDGYTADEAARIFASNYTKAQIKVVKLPFSVLRFLGMLTNKFNYAANIVEALNNYPEKFEAAETWQELGKPQTRFVAYATST
ncbi:NmrA family NAD(P)-binding protein [Hymenobacter sp. BT664]|uniref:NmrA family NAD(P)-binding protein n=1 Tax=Hymenobacter montanus TaxID=2771359 RepID=A0A927BE22_9BACT|nr:NmrA family NAD(P)-binding protein [Hymenobacter montanus]MBD2768393.1 NmrA family NAD(P)-binding protein [Hymenobacter montanus]